MMKKDVRKFFMKEMEFERLYNKKYFSFRLGSANLCESKCVYDESGNYIRYEDGMVMSKYKELNSWQDETCIKEIIAVQNDLYSIDEMLRLSDMKMISSLEYYGLVIFKDIEDNLVSWIALKKFGRQLMKYEFCRETVNPQEYTLSESDFKIFNEDLFDEFLMRHSLKQLQ